MRKSSDKDFLVVLQNLETILQEQTKISKRQSTHKTPNSKTNSVSMKSSKNKTSNIDFREKNINKEINKVNTKTPPPKRPRKLYKNTQENAIISTYTEYSSNKNRKIRKKSIDYQSPQVYKNEAKSSTHSPFSSPKPKQRIRHNSPIEQVENYNDNSYEYTGQNYTTSQLNTLCIFFLRWMKKCTEKIEAESQKKTNSKNIQFEKNGLNKNIQNEPNSFTNTLANSNTLSIERVECDPNNNQKTQMDQIPSNKIEINATPKSFKTSLPSSIISNSNSNKTTNLSPQQEKQNIEYLHPNCKDNSITTKSAIQTPNSRKNNTNKRVNFSDSINMKKIRNTENNKKKSAKSLKDTKEINTEIKDNYSNENNSIENNENTDTSEKNPNKDKTATNISTTSKLINDNNINSNNSNNFDSVEEICKIDLEETSPIPTPSAVRKMPSIGESDLNNQPNSEDIHYDSYELSEKSLSLLPPQGEGEVTDFNPSNF